MNDSDYELLINLAKSFDEMPEPAEATRGAAAFAPGDQDRPGDDFNRRGTWEDVLGPHGWRAVWQAGEKTYWKRPGKEERGWSATTGHCKGELGGDLLYVFSTNAHPFESQKCYSKFSAFTVLNHAGDFAAASRKLKDLGFGPQEIFFTRAPLRKPSAETSADPLDGDATAADLVRHNATIRWLWEGWIPLGVLTILASEPGVGKTRLCADLLRRLANGLPWPDNAPSTLPKRTCCLWVPADNQHAELGSLPSEFGFPAECLYLNATRRNPFVGTMLDVAEDLRDFEARILRVKPAVVFIDTSLNATDRSAHKPEDAKAFFKPLQEIAARTQTAILCVTHLNAAGKPLGRRIEGQGRVVIMLEKPDPAQEHRRKLYVRKSHSLFPAPLGVTMGGGGNEYDHDPPSSPDAEEPGQPNRASFLAADCEWLRTYLSMGPKRVSYTRDDAESAGISAKRLYRAKEELEIEDFESQGRKWWRLTTKSHPEN